MAQRKFLDFIDRFDGGGMGKSGDKFEGGGLLSLLGNMFVKPYGYKDRAGEEAPAGLLGEARPNMRPNRPAPSSQGMSLDSAPAMPRMPNGTKLTLPGNPSGPISDGLGPMPQRLPSDPSLGFNPANSAPVQVEGSGMTPANNYVPSSIPFDPSAAVDFTMPDGSPINYSDPRQRFASQLVEMIGPDAAENLMRSGMGEQAYEAFVANNYNMPNY